MGGGAYDPGSYTTHYAAAAASGTSFAHTRAVASGTVAAGVHALLDPKHVAGAGSPLAGQIVREARDSDEHPNSVPIIIAFDETGSMRDVPVLMQKKLAEVFGLLQLKGYVTDPQLAVGAYGDMEIGEKAPLQLSQFESDNRADEALDVVYLEGNGGGNGYESAAGIWFYAAQHTACDAWEKRGKKGYLFTIGDETTSGITRKMWKTYVDANYAGEKDLTAQEVADLAKEKWEVFHVVIDNHSARAQKSTQHYTTLLGKDRVIALEDENAVAETIAIAIGMCEGTIDLDEGLADLAAAGSDDKSRKAAGKALAKFSGGGGAVAVADAPTDLDTTDGAERL